MTPPSMDYERDREYFATRALPLFDPLGAADASASMMGALDGGSLHPAVESDLRASLDSFRQWAGLRSATDADFASAADRIERYLADPASMKSRPLPPVPPGAPI